MLTLDPTTYAEYTALTAAADRAQAVLAALANPVTVRVYNGSGQVMGQGTISAPWATRSGALLTVNPMQAFSVLLSGSPDPATWYLRFESGSRWLSGTFGLTGSGADFIWSKSTWTAGQAGFVRTVAATAYDAPVAFTWLVPDDYDLGDLQQGQTLDISALYSATEGQALSFAGYDLPVGVTVDEATGAISAAADAATGAATIEIDGRLASQIFEPALVDEAQPEQYATTDDGETSPTYRRWYGRLYLDWVNVNTGDYTDASDVPQGANWFTRTAVPTDNTLYPFNVAVLVQRALTSGRNKGFYLRATGSSPSVPFDGRTSANPPTLQVVTDQGTFNCACLCSAWWTYPPASALPADGRTTFRVSGSRFAIVRFDLSGVTGAVQSATMSLRVQDRSGTNVYVEVYEANPPTFQVGLNGDEPQLGLAAEVGEAALAAHQDVIFAGDFAGTTQTATDTWSSPKLFPRISSKNAVTIEPDPDAPGTYYWRGEFVPIQTNNDSRREAFDADYWLTLPDTSPAGAAAGYPIDMTTYLEEAWFRMYLMLEDDFDTTIEGNKMGITWDLRFGYWVPSGNAFGGYWQNIGGNGGNPGSGLRTYYADMRAALGGTTYPQEPRNVYYGNMQRMEGGVSSPVGYTYEFYRPWLGYNYQTTTALYPDQEEYGNQVHMKFRRGVSYCVEQHIRMNSIDLSAPDEFGNGIAIADGLLETWVNGVKIDIKNSYSWRRHPAMGIAGVNSNWYMGGQASHPVDEGNMHFRLNHLVLARRYIGPRVRP